MADPRESEYVLAPGEFAYIADQTQGSISVSVGPCKINLQMTDQPMTFDPRTSKFTRCQSIREAIQYAPLADERSYVVLQNPSVIDTDPHPKSSAKNTQVPLKYGQTINLPGPCTFALWPGQIATVIKGHQLRSNEYLVVEVTNAERANKDEEKKYETGELLIVKGTETSFYIPSTGFKVVSEPETAKWVRDAVTLERLEYCILLDESGDKRYVKGPDVVFPSPTETFVTIDGSRKYRALELNDQMGIHIKVIADYSENDKDYKAGEEIFVTGKQQRIYYPRSEHAIIKYGDQVVQYAIAIPNGEGRYVLKKETGNVELVAGPMMFMPNPIEQVIVRRVLTTGQVELWFPGNEVALNHNLRLSELAGNSMGSGLQGYVSDDQVRTRGTPRSMTKNFSASGSAADMVADEVRRQSSYTPPRTITLDTKYDGAVYINVWPGYAVQVVSRSGERRVVEGPKSVLLGYDETLEVLSLSKGRPKSTSDLIRTPYLRVSNNRVSDLVEADTKDLVQVKITVFYRVNFEGDSNKWFSTENYVQFMVDHLRSLIRNAVKKVGIEELTDNVADIIRDNVLGKSVEGKRTGRAFPENGMRVYDVEILKVIIDNAAISQMLQSSQQETVSKALQAVQKQKTLEVTKKLSAIEIELIKTGSEVTMTRLETTQQQTTKEAELTSDKLKIEQQEQSLRESIFLAERKRVEIAEQFAFEMAKLRATLDTINYKEKLSAIQPGLIEAINNAAKMGLMTQLTSNLPQATGGLGLLLGKGGMEGLLKMVQGNEVLTEALKNLNK